MAAMRENPPHPTTHLVCAGGFVVTRTGCLALCLGALSLLGCGDPAAADPFPPSPDPMQWSLRPQAASPSSIKMKAVEAEDPDGVEYYFETLTAGGHDSGWQAETTYLDTGLTEGQAYSYRVKARDLSASHNETAFSGEAAATAGVLRRRIIDLSMPGVGQNIDGPSLVRVPDWIPPASRAHPSAVYYLYFANHGGDYIRMAWASDVMGPYTIYNPGAGVLHDDAVVLQHAETGWHMASPDVHVDDANQRFVMYFHTDTKWDGQRLQVGEGQYTLVATSTDGLDFNAGVVDMIICPFYARVFPWSGGLYTIIRSGQVWKARDPQHPWVNPPPGQAEVDIVANGGLWEKLSDWNPWDDVVNPFDGMDGRNIRHNALRLRGDRLDVFYSRSGQAPERIEVSTIDLSPGENNWVASDPVTVIAPLYEWEGADLPIEPSGSGSATGVHQLRDPHVFEDSDGSEYLLYSGRGEECIGIVPLAAVLPDGFEALPVLSVGDVSAAEGDAGATALTITVTAESPEAPAP